jgi:hypothetical protein
MPFYITQIFRREGIFRLAVIAAIIVIIGGLLGYYGYRGWKKNPEFFKKLPATISDWVKPKEEKTPEEIAQGEASPETVLPEKKTYVETAGPGEGITHLARRALREYLSENSQSFSVTPEHKIYIEDYIAKKMGSGWLKLGEQLEISGGLIQSAINAAANLTPEQLDNLTQFSQLVPSLNY